ncbi:putative membrane protein [Candidatus Methanoperedens nitroreducens]|uniref:Putative membrane protein n=1 Tax=Candidatus Methanoperedens nitratireducens TaxID=1392998 RepID=A0A062V6G0_9EURY|nr:phosphate-starvation-inducible PsiE family protein [Candidatus Methanoperedens nitroreducens]KCZ71369.1 putative membrane protein [Candidatus Methanoperedens nitroreducens]MDJ1420998.1 phosphate-starvation-inducible PsiE family protein [Candidatus Methanoperedens sp.]
MIDHAKFFKKITDSIVTVILYVLLLALIAGMLRILLDMRFVAVDSIEGGFHKIVTNVLTLFIVIEFFKTFADYSRHERIKLTLITDATILIVMREITVGLYSRSFGYETVFSLSALLLVLGVIRVLAVRYSPEKV